MNVRLVLVAMMLVSSGLLFATSATAVDTVSCNEDGTIGLWIGSYVDKFDPMDPGTWDDTIVHQGFACCYTPWHPGQPLCRTYVDEIVTTEVSP